MTQDAVAGRSPPPIARSPRRATRILQRTADRAGLCPVLDKRCAHHRSSRSGFRGYQSSTRTEDRRRTTEQILYCNLFSVVRPPSFASIEQRHGPGPAGRAGFHLVRKARHGEAVAGELFEIAQLLHVAVGNLSSGLVTLPDDRRIARS